MPYRLCVKQGDLRKIKHHGLNLVYLCVLSLLFLASHAILIPSHNMHTEVLCLCSKLRQKQIYYHLRGSRVLLVLGLMPMPISMEVVYDT